MLIAVASDGWPVDRRTVIVAIDGPDPSLEAIARRYGAQPVVLPEPVGSYSARNAAIDALPADADFVLFTDADCIPQAGWTGAHVAALEDCDLSGGAIEVTTRQPPSPAEVVDKLRHLHQEDYVARDGYAATANLGVRREVADIRFDGSLASGGDAEFCQRAVRAGYRLQYTPDAVVEHPARTTVGELMRKVRRISHGIRSRPDPWLARPLPGFRWPHRVVWRVRADGMSRGPRWDWPAAALYLAAELQINVAALRAKLKARASSR